MSYTVRDTGSIYTIAGLIGQSNLGVISGDGSAATSAQLSSPGGIGIDSKFNLIFADTGNNRIRNVASGIITTIAGSLSRDDYLYEFEHDLLLMSSTKVDIMQ